MKHVFLCLALFASALFVPAPAQVSTSTSSGSSSGFSRTETDTLVPTLIAYPDRVERVDGSATKPAPLGNSLKIAFDLAKSDAREVIGVFGTTRGVTIGDGKSVWYSDSVNKAGGVRRIHVVGLSSDAKIVGSIIVQNRPASTEVNGWIGFHRLELDASAYTYGCVQTFMGNRPTYALEFVEVVFVPTHSTYSHGRLQGPASFSVRDCTFAKCPDGRPIREHNWYFDNWCGDSELVNNIGDTPGRSFCQATNRIESGAPQIGSLLIQGNDIRQPLDAFAITVAGQSDPAGSVLIIGNTITIDGDVDGDGVHDWDVDSTAGAIVCYREGANVSLPIPKLGAYPVGTPATHNYTVTNLPSGSLPCLNRVVIRGNTIVGNNLKKQLVAVGSCKTLRVGDRSLFASNNRNALDIHHQGMIETIELTFGANYRGWQAKGGKMYDRSKTHAQALTDAQIDAFHVLSPSSN